MLTKKQWKKRSGALRKLIHNPELQVSGEFARVYGDGDMEFLYNARTNRVIARIAQGICFTQYKSLYNDLIATQFDTLTIERGDIQAATIKQVGRALTRKEGFHARSNTQPARGKVQPRVGYQIVYDEFTSTSSSSLERVYNDYILGRNDAWSSANWTIQP